MRRPTLSKLVLSILLLVPVPTWAAAGGLDLTSLPSAADAPAATLPANSGDDDFAFHAPPMRPPRAHNQPS